MIQPIRKHILILTILTTSLLLAACSAISGQQTAATPTPLPVQQVDETSIVAEGRVVPKDSVDLSFGAAGQVAEILFQEGDQVKVGDVIARLGNTEELESAIAGAEVELLNAQQALKDLEDNNQAAIVATVQKISQFNEAVKKARYDLFYYTVPSSIADLDVFEAIQVTSEKLAAAREAYEPYKLKPDPDVVAEPKNQTANQRYQKSLQDAMERAQSDYNAAVKRLELKTRLDEAEFYLKEAEKDYAMYQAGPDPDQVALLQARIKAAQASITAAQARLSNLELTATIDGTILNLNITKGEQVAPGALPHVSIADLSQWFVETDNLTEIDVVRVETGQKVKIVADALPDIEMIGTVESIKNKFEEKRGDITYTVKIALDDPDPRLRWGMTVAITFEE